MKLAVDLEHRFADFELAVSFEAPGGVTALFGHSGSGKTTIAGAIAGLLRPDRGRILLGETVLTDTSKGVNLAPQRRRLGYIFQEGRLFPHLSVRHNLLYGRRLAPVPLDDANVDRIIAMLGIGDLMERRPSLLSGGEQQRVAIGRALIANPAMLIADEPLSSLDDARKAEILPYFERLREDGRVPVLYISHSVSEIARLANHVVLIEQGRVVGSGSVEQVLGDPDLAPMLGIREAGALLRARVVAHHADGLSEVSFSGGRLLLPAIGVQPGGAIGVRIHAHDVMLSLDHPQSLSALNVLSGTVVQIRHGSGPGALVRLQVGEDALLARVTKRSVDRLALQPGLACFAVIKSVSVAPGAIGSAHPGQRTDGGQA